MCVLMELSSSAELLEDFVETPGLVEVVNVLNKYTSDAHTQMFAAGYLCNLMKGKDIPKAFIEAKGVAAAVFSLGTYIRKRKLMTMFCELLFSLVTNYPEATKRVSYDATPVLLKCIKKNEKKVELLEPPVRLLTLLMRDASSVCYANEVLKGCMDVVFEHNEDKTVLPPMLTIATLVLKSGQVTIDFLKSETLKFFYQLCGLYKQEPVVLGYLLGVVCTIAFLSRHNLDQLEDFNAVNAVKAGGGQPEGVREDGAGAAVRRRPAESVHGPGVVSADDGGAPRAGSVPGGDGQLPEQQGPGAVLPGGLLEPAGPARLLEGVHGASGRGQHAEVHAVPATEHRRDHAT